jgi:hypothetical protein
LSKTTQDTEYFLDDRPLHNATVQEAADCLVFIEKRRQLVKLGGFGTISVCMNNGRLTVWKTTDEQHCTGA